MREQFLLVCLDEERAVTALPRLLGADAAERNAALDILHRVLAARGAISDEGRRRLARIEALFDAQAGDSPRRRRPPMPDTADRSAPAAHEKYQRLIKLAQRQAAIKVAVAHPCDDVSLQGAVEAARLRLIEPMLVGPVERIRRTAESAALDIGAMEIVQSAAQRRFRGEGS